MWCCKTKLWAIVRQSRLKATCDRAGTIPGLKLTGIFVHTPVYLGGIVNYYCRRGFRIEMQHFSALKMCSFMLWSCTVIVLISLYYGSGQLLMVPTIFRQYRESKNDWSLFNPVTSSVCMSVLLLMKNDMLSCYPWHKNTHCCLLSS